MAPTLRRTSSLRTTVAAARLSTIRRFRLPPEKAPLLPTCCAIGKRLLRTNWPALLSMYNLHLAYLPDGNQASMMSVSGGNDNANIALLGNYMASIFACGE